MVRNLPMADLLHSMQNGMLYYLQKSIFHFMKTHDWLSKYNEIRISTPAHPDLIEIT